MAKYYILLKKKEDKLDGYYVTRWNKICTQLISSWFGAACICEWKKQTGERGSWVVPFYFPYTHTWNGYKEEKKTLPN